MYEVIFLSVVVREIEHAAIWYSDQEHNLGEKFKRNIFAAIEKLQSDKVIHGPAYNDLSRIFVKRFPQYV